MRAVALEAPPSWPVAGGKRAFIQRLFTDLAPRYDRFNRLASCGLDHRWRRRAVGEARLTPPMRVLDVCTGTGDLALLCAGGAQPPAAVIGVDMNRAMLSGAARKDRAAGARVGWVEADALALPFAGGSFDRVLIGFSARNLTNLSEGLREMVRVLRPDGQLLILETGRPANPLVRAGYLLFLHVVARTIGWLLTGRCWPFTYLARSVREFLTPEQVLDALRSARTRPRYLPLSGGLASLFIATKVA